MKRLLLAGVSVLMMNASASVMQGDLPPRSELVQRVSDTVTEYRMPLSAVQEAGRTLRMDDLQIITGQRDRVTLEFPRDTQVDSVFQALRFDNPAFECEARACGRSNLWANTLYGISQLYGRDRNQRYQAVQLDSGWRTLYVIQRGTGEVYAHIEQLTPTTDVTPLLLQVTPDADGALVPADVTAMRRLIEQAPERVWELRVQVQAEQGFETDRARAQALVRSLTQQTQGLELRVRNLGPGMTTQIQLLGFVP